MGWDPFKGIKSTLKAIEKPFRTGRSAAEREQRRVAENQDAQTQQFIDLAAPAFEFGTEQLRGLGTMLDEQRDFSDPAQLAGLFSELSGGPLAEAITGERQRAATSALASSGLRRSGGAIRQAAQIPTDTILGLMNTIFGQRQQNVNNRTNLASLGLGQGSSILSGIGGLGRGADAMSQAAANRIGILGGLSGLAMQGASLIPGLSDERVKENIIKIGETENGINIYQYNYVGDNETVVGVIAQEVQEKNPSAVVEGDDGLLRVNYDMVA